MICQTVLTGYIKIQVQIGLSIHFLPSYLGPSLGGSRLSKVVLTSSPQLLLGDPEAFPCQMGYIISPACSWSTLRPLSSWTCQENLQRRHSGSIPIIYPNHLNWLFLTQTSSCSSLSSSPSL